MTTPKKPSKFNFEKSLEKLTALVDKMEQGNLSLEASLQNFESGIKLIRQCQEALSTAEQKVQILSDQNGANSLEDFSDHE